MASVLTSADMGAGAVSDFGPEPVKVLATAWPGAACVLTRGALEAGEIGGHCQP